MKKLFLLSVATLLATISFAQFSITYKNNAAVAGDSVISKEFKYTSPGDAGKEQVWDFSGVQFTGKNVVGNIYPSNPNELKAAGTYNMVSSEDGYNYLNNVNQDGVELKGYISEKGNLVYSDPMVRIKYPFSYGDNFSDKFVGSTTFGGEVQKNFDGYTNVNADASGTLIMPDRIIRNCLRVKSEKNAIDVSQCGVTDSRMVQYSWYAPGYRYPVVSMTSREVKYNGQEQACITQTAYISTQQVTNGSLVSGVELQNADDNADFSVVTYPNPFSDKVSYYYFIKKEMRVQVGLYDLSGKFLTDLVKKQAQPDGLYSGSIDDAVANLTPGIYYIRFTFDKKTVVQKIVKI